MSPVRSSGFVREQQKAAQPDNKRTILVIEPSFGIREMIRWALDLAGYRTVSLEGEAIETQMGEPPALILLDVSLREATFLRQFEQQWYRAQIYSLPPIVLLTTNPTLAQQEGYPVLPKPFHLGELYNLVKMATENKEQEERRDRCQVRGK